MMVHLGIVILLPIVIHSEITIKIPTNIISTKVLWFRDLIIEDTT